jgi:PAS domain S-box-containing protein
MTILAAATACIVALFLGSIVLRRYAHFKRAQGFHVLLDANPLAHLVVDVETLRIVDANRAAVEFYGFPIEVLKRMKISEINMMEESQLSQEVTEVCRKGRVSLQRRHRCAGGIKEVEVWTSVLELEGRRLFHSTVLDVSERNLAQSEASQLFEAMFRNSPAPMALSSLPERRYSQVNTAFLQLLGLAEEEVVGRTPKETGILVDSDVFETVSQNLARDGKFSGIELKLRPRNGKTLHAMLSGETLRTREGEFLLTNLIDLTDQVAIHRADRRIRAGFVNSSVAQAIISQEGKFLQVNHALASLLGYEAAELEGRSFQEITHPEDVEISENNLREYALKGVPLQFEKRYLTRTGKLVWIEVNSAFVPEQEGMPGYYVGTYFDVTARKEAEERLLRQEHDLRELLGEVELFKTMVEVSGDAFYVADMDDGGRMIYLNEAAEKHFGASREEIFTWNATNFDVDVDHDGLQGLLERLRQEGRIRIQSRHRRKDGQIIPVEVSINLLRKENGRRLCFGWFINISSRLEAETRLREAKHAAEEASRAKSQFLANMSHEIRTPINGVLGMAELLLDTPLGQEQRHLAQVIETSAEALLSIVNDILDYSKIEAGKLALESSDFDLESLLDEVGAGEALHAQRKGLELVCSLNPEVPVALRGDPGRLRQILLNLVGNAIKFTAHGEVCVHAGLVRTEDETALLRFSVKDTGIGIPAAKRALLFQRFSQVDASTTRKYGGSGLGLVICRELSELMGGEIGLESREGEGSEFWFTARLEVRAAPLPSTDFGGVRILLVGKRPSLAEPLWERLKAWNARPVLVREESQALALLAEAGEEPFRVAILDHSLPDLDAQALGERIRKATEGSRTRLLLLCDYARFGQKESAPDPTFAALLPKPVRFGELARTLHHLLEEAPAPRIPAREIRKLRERERRILLVEDSLTNQQVALSILKKLGLEADAVDNGQEALVALARTHYDLVLMDCQMPEMDGFETSRRIRAGEGGSERALPIVAMTANVMEGNREACLEAGMDDFLGKPVSIRALSQCLDRWLPRD